MRDLKYNILLLFVFCLLCFTANAQCVDESNYWIESWTSCEVSANPNTARGNTVWLLFEFDNPEAIATTQIWNANRIGESTRGGKTVFIDVSMDGMNWTQVGDAAFAWPQAEESEDYEGFAGPDLSSFGFVEKVLFTFVDNHEASDCMSISELRFDINQEACYGKIDACGVCDGAGAQTYYEDADNDGLGNPNVMMESCDPPIGFVANKNDTCDNGLLGWSDVASLFEDNNCNGCHGGPEPAGNLDLNSYEGILAGGDLCGTNILTGTVLVDVILISDYDGCSTPIPFPSMNERAGGAMDIAEIQMIQKWIDDGALGDCNCPEGSPDNDGDGVCDNSDACPDFDDALIGTPCDDGDPCTDQDVIRSNCECVGMPGADSDFDGICDAVDAAPHDACTADGIIGLPEPSGWVALASNDCDADKIMISQGDLNDFDDCINHQGTSLRPECACANSAEIGGGGKVSVAEGISAVLEAEGVPDGRFSTNISINDFVEMDFPYMEIGTEICFAVGFNSPDGGVQFEVNKLGIYKFLNPDPALMDLEPQTICFTTFVEGEQNIRISRYISGAVRIDGATYSYCPCTESDPNRALIACACPNDFTQEVGVYTGSIGINDADLSDGAPDGEFTGNIGSNDSLILTYPSLPENYQICLDVLFSEIDGIMSLNVNGEEQFIINPAGFGEEDQVQQVCFFTKSNDNHTVVVKDVGPGVFKIDGSTCGFCNPCLVDVDGDGICDDVDDCLAGDNALDEDGDGIADACDDCNGNLIGQACDDGIDCTEDDVYDANCNCVGVFSGQVEIPYDGIDNDCDPTTLDDDLDQDGFVNAEDCDDENVQINPDAEDIPANGIDEDCDGEDLLTAVHDLAEATVVIYPNPVAVLIHIEVDGLPNYRATLYTLEGKTIQSAINQNKINVADIAQGIYFLEVEDLRTGQRIIEKIVVAR